MSKMTFTFVFKPPQLNVLNLCKSEFRNYQFNIPESSKEIMSMIWPPDVYILSPVWAVIDGPPGANSNNWPQTVDGWFQNELRCPECIGSRPAQLQLQCKILRYRFDSLLSEQSKRSNTFTPFDAYNAVWASLGYVEGQSPKVIELCNRKYKPTNSTTR